MKRVQRTRWERTSRALITVGLSFALGALSAIGLQWRLKVVEPEPPVIVAEQAAAHGVGNQRRRHNRDRQSVRQRLDRVTHA